MHESHNTKWLACSVFQLYERKIFIYLPSNVEQAQSVKPYAGRCALLTVAGSNLQYSTFLFYLFIKLSSFVHLLLFLNLFEEQTTVQYPLKNLGSCACSTTRSVACSVSYKITTFARKLSLWMTQIHEKVTCSEKSVWFDFYGPFNILNI